jgi:thiol:disulfide interchange protein DsbA
MKILKSFIGITCLLIASFVCAQDLREGREYKLLNPVQPVETKGKIEVIEFFWYGCPHCFDFEPVLQKWAKALPKDVVFRRVPALFPGERWKSEARTYYALESLGLVDKLHQEVFDAIHVDRTRMNDEATLFGWMEKKGVDRKKFEEAYNSFAVQSKTQRSLQLTQAYQLQGVPALVINGKYLPSLEAAGGSENVLKFADKLISKARAEQGMPEPGAAEQKPAKKDKK